MNAKARQLGLKNTRFHEPTGLSMSNVSTPREIIVMLKQVIAHPVLGPITRRGEYDAHPVGKPPIKYINTDHAAARSNVQLLGGKTGYNDFARYCLVVATKIDGRTYYMAFLGDEGKLTRFGDVARVADWIVSHKPKTRRSRRASRDRPPTARPSRDGGRRRPRAASAPAPSRSGRRAAPAPPRARGAAPRPRRPDRAPNAGEALGSPRADHRRRAADDAQRRQLPPRRRRHARRGAEDAVVEAGVVRRAQPLRVRDALPAGRGGGQARAGRDRQRRQVLAQAEGDLRHRPRPRDRRTRCARSGSRPTTSTSS